MKKIVAVLLLVIFFAPDLVFAKATPRKISGMVENDFILDTMLPNPSVYLYGVDSNGFPILLINFSLTIPVFALDDNPLLRPFQFLGRFAPTFHKKTKSLKSIALYLKLNESKESADGKKFYYKITKLQCDQEDQGLKYKDTSEWKLHGEGSYSQSGGNAKGTIDRNMAREINYESRLPIRDYSGVGSDTLKIILKRGRKYPIRAGHMNISMVVTAIPYYKNPPLNYCSLKCNCCNYDFVKDFMVDTNPEAPCTPVIRKIYFSKIYSDNSIMNYYEVSPSNNPNGLILDSEVVMGNRINGCPILDFCKITTTKSCKNKNKSVSADTELCNKLSGKTKATEANAGNVSLNSDNVCGDRNISEDNCIQTKRCIENSYGLILDDGNFMYDNIFKKQLPNTESVSECDDESLNKSILTLPITTKKGSQ